MVFHQSFSFHVVLLLLLLSNLPSPVASVSPDSRIFGHNMIIGPIYTVPYDAGAVVDAAQAMWSGQLRYPGGTVANYWYWPNATYIYPCHGDPPPPELPAEASCELQFPDVDLGENDNGEPRTWNYYTYGCRQLDIGGGEGACLSDAGHCPVGDTWYQSGYCGANTLGISCGCCVPKDPTAPTPSPTPASNDHGIADGGGDHGWDYCSKKTLTDDGAPAGSFSPANFSQHLASRSPVSSSSGPLWDLNVLSATEEQVRMCGEPTPPSSFSNASNAQPDHRAVGIP